MRIIGIRHSLSDLLKQGLAFLSGDVTCFILNAIELLTEMVSRFLEPAQSEVHESGRLVPRSEELQLILQHALDSNSTITRRD